VAGCKIWRKIMRDSSQRRWASTCLTV